MDGSAARAVLGVAPGTSRAHIDIAFRRLAKATHPDRGGSAAAFRRLLEARQVALDAAPVARPSMPFIDATTLPDAPSWGFTPQPTQPSMSFASHLRVAMRV